MGEWHTGTGRALSSRPSTRSTEGPTVTKQFRNIVHNLVFVAAVPAVVFWTARTLLGLHAGLVVLAGWQLGGAALGKASMLRGAAGANAVARLSVCVFAPSLVAWLPVLTGTLSSAALSSQRIAQRIWDEVAGSGSAAPLSRLWAVQQGVVAAANAAGALLVPVDVWVSVRPLIGWALGAPAAYYTYRRARDGAHQTQSVSEAVAQ